MQAIWKLCNLEIMFLRWQQCLLFLFLLKASPFPKPSSTLAWKIQWMEEPGRLQSRGWRRVDSTERLHFHFSLSCIEEGNGNPLQCSCLENPRDRGAWWAAVYGVAQGRTRLKRLSRQQITSYWSFLNLWSVTCQVWIIVVVTMQICRELNNAYKPCSSLSGPR